MNRLYDRGRAITGSEGVTDQEDAEPPIRGSHEGIHTEGTAEV